VRNTALLGIDSVQTPIGERRAVWDRMVDLYPTEAVDGMVAAEIGLGGLDAALATIVAGAARGRVLVRPNP